MHRSAALSLATITCLGVLGCSQVKPDPLTMDDFDQALESRGVKVENRKPQITKFIKAEAGEAFDANGTACEVYIWDLSTKDGTSGYENTQEYGFYGGETVMTKNMGVTCKGETAEGKTVLAIAKEL